MGLVRPHVPQLKVEQLLDAKVSWIAKVINDWFAERGFSIKLTDQGDPNTFYAGSIYEQLIHWLVPGERWQLQGRNGQTYPDSVMMENGIAFWQSSMFSEVVASIKTRVDEDIAYMVMLDNPSTEPFGLLQFAQRIEQSLNPADGFGELQFPMVHIDHETDVSWLVNLWTRRDSGQKAWVREAKQQSILKINEKGALAKSGFGMSVSLEMLVFQRKPLIIDRPFLFWISRKGYPLPLFSAWVDYTEWKDPGDLE
ncbi:hypothetical protein A2154_03810 [Candidatus Gottesmanbacteria bacterium RBG_16_43_7]|uniref:Serpin domain-containing protein n=1 Tax=Candidatus Gottesmanbacteria bacterium RBG_16_43_7 TaxID=1798373 RepID=A0A1F5Z8G8_9BACT|nr:MAG: hypothetical protein A2154_03810 [Candidatus Gottesmanbacteria bacterium RBG_16_43_7]